MRFKWGQLRGDRHGVPGISDEHRSAFVSLRDAVISEAGSVPTSVTQRGKRQRGIGEQQEAQAMSSTGGNDWDDSFEDINDGAGNSAGDQDYETGNNADDKFNLDKAVDESWDPTNANNAFDAYTMSLSQRVKVRRKTWAGTGRKQRALAWQSSRSANVLGVMEAN
ncbi:hypothetical protein HDU78_011549 [Chytriomyces hyalinus]|nr:hypothetical protein HDU78_011549 [Chytriomyces hyalinus]